MSTLKAHEFPFRPMSRVTVSSGYTRIRHYDCARCGRPILRMCPRKCFSIATPPAKALSCGAVMMLGLPYPGNARAGLRLSLIAVPGRTASTAGGDGVRCVLMALASILPATAGALRLPWWTVLVLGVSGRPGLSRHQSAHGQEAASTSGSLARWRPGHGRQHCCLRCPVRAGAAPQDDLSPGAGGR